MSDPITRLNAALQGRYHLERELGEGGMATVYLADDLKHERKVALKVLKPELAAVVGAERFLAEIKTTAGLQHPNILPLFDSGEADGFLFYVMPYVEGETLRQRIDREKQLPLDEAVSIATAVAQALRHAHDRGVIHRDIKPGNILLQDGQPVVSDFGIALAVGSAAGARLTETGLSVGTPYYMSPEQATGDQQVGPPTDTYALAVVLYEMLTGDPPYIGSTAQAVLGKIIQGTPVAAAEIRKAVPANVDAAIRRGLEKLPADRFTGAHDFERALADSGFRHAEEAAAVVQGGAGARSGWWPMVNAVGLLALGALALWLWLRPPVTPAGEGRLTRTVIPFPDGHVIQLPYGAFPFDLSADGLRLTFVSVEAGRPRLYVRDLETIGATALEGTEGARHPFFSPDGEWVGFFADGELHKATVDGRLVVPLASVDRGSGGASWGPNNTIVYSLPPEGLFRVHDTGGVPEALELRFDEDADELALQAPPQPGSLRWPDHLPGGRHLLVSARVGPVLVDLETLSARRIPASGNQPTYVDGHLVLTEGEGQLIAVPFDLARLEVTGSPVSVSETPYVAPGGGATLFRIDRNGSLVYVEGGLNRALVAVDRNGRERPQPIATELRGYRVPRFSPDGTEILVTVDPPPGEIWSVDVQRGTSEPLLRSGAHTLMPLWHPDGESFAVRLGSSTVIVDRADLSIGAPVSRSQVLWPISWSSDGRALFLNGVPSGSATVSEVDLFWMDLVTDTVAHALTEGPSRDENPRISPLGDYLAYASDRTGTDEVYVGSWPEWGGPWRVSLEGGREPLWSRDGTELFFVSGKRIMTVDATGGFPAPDPTELFRGDWDLAQALNWDVNDDGDFVFVRGPPGAMRQFQYVANWVEQLRASPNAGN